VTALLVGVLAVGHGEQKFFPDGPLTRSPTPRTRPAQNGTSTFFDLAYNPS
jgi:hypothetical protein